MTNRHAHKWEAVLVAVTAISYSVINTFHVFREWFRNSPNDVFVGIAHYYGDFFLYVSQFAYGAVGQFLSPHAFTSEPLAPTWIYWFNALLGFIGRLVGLTPYRSYDVFLFLLGLALPLVWYWFMHLLFPKDRFIRLTAFLFVISASPLIDLLLFIRTGAVKFPDYIWFSPSLSLNRLGGVPHQMFQTMLYILLAVIAGRSLRAATSRRIILTAVLTVLATTANPVQMLVFAPSVALAGLVECLKKHRVVQPAVFTVIIVLLTSLPSALVTNEAFRHPIFAAAKAWELQQYSPRMIDHFLTTIGPIVILIPFGVLPFFRSLTPITMVYALYGIGTIILFFSPIPRVVGVLPTRFLHPAAYGLIPVLAALGLEALYRLPMHLPVSLSFRVKRVIGMTILAAFAGIYLLMTVPATIEQVALRGPERNPYSLLDSLYNHVPKQIVAGLEFLKTAPANPNRNVVLSDSAVRYELLVPAFTRKPSYSGHPLHTLMPQEKELLRIRFFSGDMKPDEAASFLISHRIGFILSSPTSPSLGALGKYPFLRNAFETTMIRIYVFSPER